MAIDEMEKLPFAAAREIAAQQNSMPTKCRFAIDGAGPNTESRPQEQEKRPICWTADERSLVMKKFILSGASIAVLSLGLAAWPLAAQQMDSQTPGATGDEPMTPTTPPAGTPTPGGDTGMEAGADEPTPTGELQAEATQPEGSVLIEDVLAADVVDASGESVASVDSVLMSPDGTVTHVLVTYGGLLGMGGKEVLVPWDQASFNAEEGILRIPGNEADLEAAPEFTSLKDLREQQAEVPETPAQPAE